MIVNTVYAQLSPQCREYLFYPIEFDGIRKHNNQPVRPELVEGCGCVGSVHGSTSSPRTEGAVL